LDAGKLTKEWARAYFAQRLYMQQQNDEYKMIVENALSNLEKMDKMQGVLFGLDPQTGHRYNIDKFVLEMRWRMANPSRAKDEDRIILKSVTDKINVKIN
jgi:hypothetical protein